MSSTRFFTARAARWLGAPVLLALTLPATALAEAIDVGRIPNGQSLGCANCHTNNDRNNLGVFNPWGEAIRAIEGANGDVDWARDCSADADGDGHSNGAELGDPDCVWTIGDTPAMERTGHPGDPNIVPGDVMPEPMEPEPMEPEPGEPEPGEPEPGEPEPGEPEPGEPEPPPGDGGVNDPQQGGAVISLDDGCSQAPGAPTSGGWLLAFGLLLVRRRR